MNTDSINFDIYNVQSSSENNESYDFESNHNKSNEYNSSNDNNNNDNDNDNSKSDIINHEDVLLAVNVIHMDYAMVKSKHNFDFIESLDSPLPVIRIFGSSWSGQKVCVHIHGALPYFYFRPDNIDDTTFDNEEEVKTYLPKMKDSLEEILNASYPSDYFKRVHIHKLEVVMRRPVYGYFSNDIPFIKITLRSPNYFRKVISILEDDALGVRMQTYDSHYPYLLKFTVDCNIVPMGWLFIKNGRFRKPLPINGFSFDPPKEKNCNSNEVVNEKETGPVDNTSTNSNQFSSNSSKEISPTIFTQFTTNADNIWNDYIGDINHIRQDSEFKDMSSQDFNLLLQTQVDQMNSKICKDNRDKNKDDEIVKEFDLEKVSSCDLEIDIHIKDILNASLARKKFGEDLWDEEKARRKRKGLSQEKVFTPPSTNTDHRTKGDVDVEFENRLSNLLVKSRLLNQAKIGSQSSNDQSPIENRENLINDWVLAASQQVSYQIESDKVLKDMLRNTSSAAKNYLNNNSTTNVNNNSEFISELLFEIIIDIFNDHEPSFEIDLDEDEENDNKVESENILKFSESQKYDNDQANDNDLFEHLINNDNDNDNDNNSSYNNKMELDQGVESIKNYDDEYDKPIVVREPIKSFKRVFSQSKRKHSSICSTPLIINHNIGGVDANTSAHEDTNLEISPIKSSRYDFESSQQSKFIDYTTMDKNPNLDYIGSSSSFILKPADQGICLVPPNRMNLKSLESFGINNTINDPLRDTGASVPKHNQFMRKHSVLYGNKYNTFDGGFPSSSSSALNNLGKVNCLVRRKRCLLPTFLPPSPKVIRQEASKPGYEKNFKSKIRNDRSQIQTPTPSNETASIGLAMNIGTITNKESLKSRLTMMSIEMFSSTSDIAKLSFLPDPKDAPVRILSWHVEDNMSDAETECIQRISGIISLIVVNPGNNIDSEKFKEKKLILASGIPLGTKVCIVTSENDLFRELIHEVRSKDPDILMGYEIQKGSFGYLIARAKFLGIDLLQELSKVPKEKPIPSTEWAENSESGIFITGRITLNLWRRMKAELKLMSYSYQNVASHLLSRKVPEFTQEQLARWYRNPLTRGNIFRHIHSVAILNFYFLDKLDLIRRTSESARLYGIDFFSVLTRGSQFRVEASILRNMFQSNFVAISPSKRKVASQAAMAVIPLVLEPISRFYEDPVLVLDFQSLYPSMIIAYNLCYSTIMGKLNPGSGNPDTTGRLGVITYSEKFSSIGVMKLDEEGTKPFVAPNGSIFCPKEVKHGLLPTMLKDILETRLMIKRAMKVHKDPASKLLLRSLDARQLAIKLLSNVTYGYTAAGFTGRMPMAELADAIVHCGRSTLEDAIGVIRSNEKWKAEVVYGDTDSIFVLLKNRSKSEAFKIGKEIVNTITARNPKDVVLKFEKVYYPCILVSKKRYVGNSYESISQSEPHFDAKGIEVVRRDQCPATAKIQEKALRILFNTRDLTEVRKYLQSQWIKIHQGTDKVLINDFIFCKEVRMDTYRGNPPPAAVVASVARHKDPMAEPPFKWRVPYVKVCGKGRLMDLVVAPHNLLIRGSDLVLDINYYIDKCINPALERVFGLCESSGVVERWYKNSPKGRPFRRHISYDDISTEKKDDINRSNHNNTLKQQTITSFVKKGTCEICCATPSDIICDNCKEDQARSLLVLTTKLNTLSLTDYTYKKICENCTRQTQYSTFFKKSHLIGPDCCSSIDCQIFFKRLRTITRIEDTQVALDHLLNENNLEW